jgi:hypothetical protein
MVRVPSRSAQVRLLFCGSAAPPLLVRGGPLTPPEGVLGPLLRPAWRLPSAAPLWNALLPKPVAMQLSNSFLSLADAPARWFQQRFPEVIRLDDACHVSRHALISAAACAKPGLQIPTSPISLAISW